MDAYRFEDPRPLGAFVMLVAAAGSLLRLALAGGEFYLADLIRGLLRHDPAARSAFLAHRQLLVTASHSMDRINIGLALVGIILFCFWMHRVSANIRALGAQSLEFTPGWAVGYMFIPFVNLVMTYRAMREVWMTSHDPGERTARASPLPVLAWWLIYLGAGFLGMIANAFLADSTHDPRRAAVAMTWQAGGLMAGLVASGLFMYMVWRIGRLQIASHRQAQSIPDTGRQGALQTA